MSTVSGARQSSHGSSLLRTINGFPVGLVLFKRLKLSQESFGCWRLGLIPVMAAFVGPFSPAPMQDIHGSHKRDLPDNPLAKTDKAVDFSCLIGYTSAPCVRRDSRSGRFLSKELQLRQPFSPPGRTSCLKGLTEVEVFRTIPSHHTHLLFFFLVIPRQFQICRYGRMRSEARGIGLAPTKMTVATSDATGDTPHNPAGRIGASDRRQAFTIITAQ